MKKGIQVLERCDDMVSKLGLFSANETKDDISTTNLKYILVCMCCLYLNNVFIKFLVI